jgi:hypothetical protein
MRRAAVRSAALAAVAAIILVVALRTLPFRHGVIVQVWLLACGGLMLLQLVSATRAPALDNEPSSFERALRSAPSPPERPPELARLEREIYLGMTGQFYLQRRLRPTLRENAEQRLRDRRGVALDSGDADVLAALGEDGWELLRPDRTEHWNPDATGIPLAELERVVAALERIQA